MKQTTQNSREGIFLTVEAPEDWGLPVLCIHPENNSDFFATELLLRITFQRDSLGGINRIIIYPPRGQKAIPGNRIN